MHSLPSAEAWLCKRVWCFPLYVKHLRSDLHTWMRCLPRQLKHKFACFAKSAFLDRLGLEGFAARNIMRLLATGVKLICLIRPFRGFLIRNIHVVWRGIIFYRFVGLRWGFRWDWLNSLCSSRSEDDIAQRRSPSHSLGAACRSQAQATSSCICNLSCKYL